MDEFIDELLKEDRACDVILPRIQVRQDLTYTDVVAARNTTFIERKVGRKKINLALSLVYTVYVVYHIVHMDTAFARL